MRVVIMIIDHHHYDHDIYVSLHIIQVPTYTYALTLYGSPFLTRDTSNDLVGGSHRIDLRASSQRQHINAEDEKKATKKKKTNFTTVVLGCVKRTSNRMSVCLTTCVHIFASACACIAYRVRICVCVRETGIQRERSRETHASHRLV